MTFLRVLSEIKGANVKVPNMIKRSNEPETTVKHILCDCKCNLCNNETCNNETYQCECKNCSTCKKDYSGNTSTSISENGKYLKSIAEFSVIV